MKGTAVRSASESSFDAAHGTENLNSSADERKWQADMEAQRSIWSTRVRTVIAGMENYVDKSADVKCISTQARRRGKVAAMFQVAGKRLFKELTTSAPSSCIVEQI